MEITEQIASVLVLVLTLSMIVYGLLQLRGTGLLQHRVKRCPICNRQIRFWQTKAYATFDAPVARHKVIEGQYWIHAAFVKCHNKCAIECRDMGQAEIAERIKENYREYDYDTYTFRQKSRQEDDIE